MIEKISEEIKVLDEMLNVMPKNNIKNQKKYHETLATVEKIYSQNLIEIENEINDRCEEYSTINDECDLNNKLYRINQMKSNLYLLNEYNTAYEKFKFDQILYKINHFYNLDLNEVNKNIILCIEKFKTVGINLTEKDFNYSEYSYEYIKSLLENPNDKVKIKKSFEKIYWHCSDLFIHIELNFKYLYNKNQKIFEKYITNEKSKFLKLFENSPLEKYRQLAINYYDYKTNSLERGLYKFINKEWNINDYSQIKIEKYYNFFTDDEPSKIINDEINKLSNSILEYKNVLLFEYILNDLKMKYKEKRNVKNELKSLNKKILGYEKMIHKYNNKQLNKTRISIKKNNAIKELEELYDKIEEINFYDRLYKFLNDDSSIYEALSFAASHYSYIIKCMKQYNIKGSFDEEYKKLMNFILNPNNNLINNVSFIEEKNLILVISDRFKLMNFNVDKDKLSNDDMLNEIIVNAKKIDIYNKIVLKLSYDKLMFILQAKELFK